MADDKYSIRHARSALARLSTDRRIVEDLLPRALEAAFAAPLSTNGDIQESQTKTIPNGHATPTDGETTWPEAAVARVNSVAPSSPAAEAVSPHLLGLHLLSRSDRRCDADGRDYKLEI